MKKFTTGSAFAFLFAVLFSFQMPASAQSVKKTAAPQLGKNSIKEIIAAMTLQEKARLVTGMGFRLPVSVRRSIEKNSHSTFRLPPGDSVDMNTPEKVPGAAGRTHAIPRLGIPSITVSDGPAGVRINPIRNDDSSKTYYATAFPVATLLASSWDTALVKKVGIAFGSEVHDYGIDVILGPALNIQRNPLGGRNFEYYSEDPLIAGKITAAMVNGIESNNVGTSIKHFAANNQETSRNNINEIISERALREIYLRGFEIAVKESQPWTVMSSYNKINGTYTSQSKDLLTTILRDEWGFKGLVMTDWFGGKDPVAQMEAGNDLLMPGTPAQAKKIIEAVQHDSLDVKILDRNVARVLQLVLKSPEFKKYKYSDKPDLKKDAQVSRRAATQGMVLLKNNNNALPLKNIKKIAAFGNTTYDIIAGGTGSGNVNKAYVISLPQGLQNAGYVVDKTLQNAYEKYIAAQKASHPQHRNFFQLPPPIPEMNIEADKMLQLSNDNDIAIITIGRNSGEGADRKLENDFYLSQAEKDLIKNVSDAFHAKNKKVVVVLNIGGVMDVASWKDEADGILLAWQPGQEAGNAIADVVSGKVNPSGKLAVTFPMNYNDVPSAKYFPGTPENKPEQVIYDEGIYVGYRYYNTFNVKPAYEFGYGLSYTNFSYSNLKLSSPTFNHSITVTVNITNNGKVAGKEVAELYLSAPGGGLKKPAEELKAFGKTNLLQPGQTQTMKFVLHPISLASYDTDQESWIAAAGKYEVKIGASSMDIKQTASFNLPKEVVVEKDHKALAPQEEIPAFKYRRHY